MITITPKDIIFGVIARYLLQHCEIAPTVFLENTRDDEIAACGVEILTDGGKKYYDICPLRQLKLSFGNFPSFLNTYRGLVNEIIIYSDGDGIEADRFLDLSLYGLSVLFSAAGRQIVSIPQELIDGLRDQLSEAHVRQFESELEKELAGLGKQWFESMRKAAQISRVHGFTWGTVIFILRIFSEAVKPVSEGPLSESEINKIAEFLKSNKGH